MLKPLIRSVDRTRFEGPLALLLGASAAFAVFAMPTDLFGALPGAGRLPFARVAMAIVTAALLAVIGYAAMRRPARKPVDAWADADLFEEEDEEEPSVRMRRADRHPDAPPRQPIRASRDLGEPFMEVGGAAPAPAPAPKAMFDAEDEEEAGGDVDQARLWSFARPAYDEPEDAAYEEAYPEDVAEEDESVPHAREVHEDAVADTAEPEAPVCEAPEIPEIADDMPAPIAAFEPEPEPAPAPVRTQRQSLSAMMDRLSAGVERRGGTPPAGLSREALADAYGQPRAAAPDLRDALEELNRLAGRR